MPCSDPWSFVVIHRIFNRVLCIPTEVVLAEFTSTAVLPPFPTAQTPLHSRVSLEDD